MNDTSKSDSHAREMIAFGLRDQEFCVDVGSMRELRAWTPATPVAHAPPFVRGVINLRGVVLPIVDLAIRLGFAPIEPNTRHAILVVETNGQLLGLLVETVSEIFTIRSEQIQPTPDVASDRSREFLRGLIALGDRMISIIGIEALTPPKDSQLAA